MDINANPQNLGNFSTRSNSDTSSSLSSPRNRLEERNIRIGSGGINIVNLFFRDYGNVGYGILKYLFSRDIRALREVCIEVCSRLFQNRVSIAPAKLRSINQYVCPRLHARVQNASSTMFQPVPVDALVQNVSDLKTILADTRFIVKGVVFTGELKDLKEICRSLPQTVQAIEIAIDIPPGERIDLRQYPQLRAVKVKNPNSDIILPEGVTVLCDNAVFDSFIGVNKLPLGKIIIEKYLAAGTFGQVYRGDWQGRPVALKKIDFEHAKKNLGLSDYEISEALKWEVSRLSTVSHPNVVQFYGIYQHENEGHTYLVMEFCKREERATDISWPKRWQWALEITEGLAYLHRQGVLHQDLKVDNILIDHNDRAKLADLGVAQVDALLQEIEVDVVAKGLRDQRFVAPENVNIEGDEKRSKRCSQASDIYALGVVFWEMTELERTKQPRELKARSDLEPCQYLTPSELEDWLSGTNIEREPVPADCPASFKELILDCWQWDPSKRPSAEKLVEKLKALGAEFNSKYHVLIKACEELEKLIHPKRKEGLAYIESFVTARKVEEPIENYWNKWESSTEKREGPNPPLKLEEIFGDFIREPSCSTLLLLGESGLGKTLTTYVWADQLMQQWWAHIKDPSIKAPPYLPLLIRPMLRAWTHADLQGAFLKVLKEYDLEGKDIPVLVVVDGYDELQVNDEAPDNLAKHLGLLEYPNAKLIVTCRPNRVKTEGLHERFNFKDKLQTFYFLPFSLGQLFQYLKEQLFWSKETEVEYQKILQRPVRQVLRNPFVLYLLKQSWETVSKQPLDQLNRWKIYEGFVRHVIITQCSLLSRQLQDALATGYLNLTDSFQVFAGHIAFRACQNKNMTLNLQEAESMFNFPWIKLEKLVAQDAHNRFTERQEGLKKMSEEEKLQTGRRVILNEEAFVSMMQSRRQQFEGALPIKIRSEGYEFSHKSLFEYFVAKRLLQFVDNNKPDFILEEQLEQLLDEMVALNTDDLYANRPLYTDELIFLYEGWKEAESSESTASMSTVTLSTSVPPDKILANRALLLTAIGRILYRRNDYRSDYYETIGADYKEVIKYYLKALAVKEKVYGKDHLNVATLCNDIALAFQAQGEYEEALEYYRKVLAIGKKVYGKEHWFVSVSYDNIGHMLYAQEKQLEALDYYVKHLAIKEKLEGKDHPDVINYMMEMVALFFEKANKAYHVGDVSTALRCYENCCAVLNEKYYPQAVNVKHNLACMYHIKALQEKGLGQEKDYLEYLSKARTTFEIVFSSLMKETIEANTYVEYAMFLLKNNKEEYEKIQSLLIHAIEYNDDSGLMYNRLEKSTTVQPLQDLIDKQNEVEVKPKSLAYYLLINLYHMYDEEIKMARVFAQFKSYASSLESQEELVVVQYLLDTAEELMKGMVVV